jgi:hypothetical protein
MSTHYRGFMSAGVLAALGMVSFGQARAITMHCAGPISGGTIDAHLVVAAHKVCTLTDVTVNGSIAVNGGTLRVNGGTISGSVLSDDGGVVTIGVDSMGAGTTIGGGVQSLNVAAQPGSLSISGATVTGLLETVDDLTVSLSDTNVVGEVVIAQTLDTVKLQSNIVSYSVQVAGTVGKSKIDGNTVLYDLTLLSNNGPSVLGNIVSGTITCIGDSPAATGQCTS